MKTFEMTAQESSWLEIAQGKSWLAFDILEATSVEIYFTENGDAPPPSSNGNKVGSWPAGWDFQQGGLTSGHDKVWIRGTGTIRGVR